MRTLETALAAHLAYDAVIAGRSEPVDGGMILRSSRFPASWDLNQVVLGPGADAAAVARGVALAEERLAGADYRRVTVFGPAEEVVAPPGWARLALLVMVLPEGEPVAWPPAVRIVDPASLHELRLEVWRGLAGPERAPQLADMQRAFATGPGAQCLAVHADGGAVAGWCQVHAGGIDDVWVVERFRSRGLGKTLVLGAIAAGGWYLNCDINDPRPQALYRKLGFRDAGLIVQLTRRVQGLGRPRTTPGRGGGPESRESSAPPRPAGPSWGAGAGGAWPASSSV